MTQSSALTHIVEITFIFQYKVEYVWRLLDYRGTHIIRASVANGFMGILLFQLH